MVFYQEYEKLCKIETTEINFKKTKCSHSGHLLRKGEGDPWWDWGGGGSYIYQRTFMANVIGKPLFHFVIKIFRK